MLENLGQVLPEAARRFGDKTTLVCGGRTFSFRGMDALAARLARSLRGLGVQPGDRVTLYAENRWEWIVSYYASARVGAVINPINAMLTPEEVLYVVRDCRASVLIASREQGAADPPIRLVAAARDHPVGNDARVAWMRTSTSTSSTARRT